MVEQLARFLPVEPSVELPPEEIKWSTVSLSEVIERKLRLEATVYDIKGKQARETLKKCRWELATIAGKNGLATAYHRPRFRRIFVERSDFPIYQPSQITEIYPKPYIWISEATHVNREALKVKKNQILISCSGTIGKSSIVSKTLDDKIFSHDLLRITALSEFDAGYLYAFLRSDIGQTLLKTNNYGAVISHIEPAHLSEIPIPNPSPIIKAEIHNLIIDSFALRDESNEMLAEAQKLLVQELKLPPIENLRPKYFDPKGDCQNFTIRLSQIDGRFESTYHRPIVQSILDQIKRCSKEITTLGDARLTSKIAVPGRFKRIHVDADYGTPFISGKQIGELAPTAKGYLSLAHHSSRIKDELMLEENTLLVTRSGTIGKIAIVPKHWENWAITDDIVKITPTNNTISGYIFAWLSSDYGKELVTRLTYGAVVGHIESHQIAKVEIPIVADGKVQQEIGGLVLESNRKRYEAFLLEEKALRIINDKVIYAEAS